MKDAGLFLCIFRIDDYIFLFKDMVNPLVYFEISSSDFSYIFTQDPHLHIIQQHEQNKALS